MSLLSYGSDNPDCTKTDYLDAVPHARPTTSNRKRFALPIVGTVLLFGCVFIVNQGLIGAGLLSLWGGSPAVATMDLDYTNVKSDFTILVLGLPFMLRVSGKDNLCIDDNNGDSVMVQRCDPTNANQIFSYNNQQIQSVYKVGQCLDDGGSTSPGSSSMYFRKCDGSSQNQWFHADASSQLIQNPAKTNLCIDDGAATGPGTTKTWLWACDPGNANQHFDVLSVIAMLDEQKNSRIAAGTQDDFDLLLSGQPLMLRLRGKNNLCVDDGSFFSITDPKFADQTCDPDSPSQIFTYNSQTRQFQSVKKPGMCIDDGGSVGPGSTQAALAKCDPNSKNQWFELDENLMLYNPAKSNLCLDDGAATGPGTTKTWMWACDNNNANQHFEVVAPAAVADARQKARIAAGVDDDIALYQSGQPFMLRLLGKNNLCADDGGGSDSNTKFKDQTCDPSSPNQIFTYNALTRQLQSVNKPGQCIDDGGATAPGSTQVSLRTCDATNPNQWFWMDDNLLFHNPVKNNLCLDDGAATGPGTTTTWLWACDPNNANQHFEVVSPLEMAKELGVSLAGQTSTNDAIGQPIPFFTPAIPLEVPVAIPETPSEDTMSVVPAQEDAEVPPPDIPVRKADMPLADYGDSDWNLLAPSNDTISLVNTDNSPAISAAEIYRYLQSLKDQADVEHDVMMYRYKRTFQCVSAGLQTLAKDAVTSDQYHVLVMWMYTHCAAGATDVAPPLNPSASLSDDILASDEVAPLVSDTEVKRQFMTKLDFYYEIKDHYAQKSEDLAAGVAVGNLRKEETMTLEEKLKDCVDEASQRFGYNQDTAGDAADHLQDAIAWVESTCMAS